MSVSCSPGSGRDLDGQPLPALPKNHLARRILQSLRSTFLVRVEVRGGKPDGQGLVRILRAFEAVGRELEGRLEGSLHRPVVRPRWTRAGRGGRP